MVGVFLVRVLPMPNRTLWTMQGRWTFGGVPMKPHGVNMPYGPMGYENVERLRNNGTKVRVVLIGARLVLDYIAP